MIERQIDLGRRIVWNLARGVSAEHSGDEQAVMGENAGRRRIASWTIRGTNRTPVRQVSHRHRSDLNRWVGNPRDPKHCTGGRNLAKKFTEDAIHVAVLAHVLKVNLDINDVVYGQVCGLDDCLEIVEGLPALFSKC